MIAFSLSDNLDPENRLLMEKFKMWLLDNKNATEKVCLFLASKIGDRGLVEDFNNLSDEIKLQACMEYLTIGLTAGSVKRKEVEYLFK